ncbi:MAG: pyridoxamine 5'-phosphate oxidase family protein [Victivallaceae bacterium]|nr:pyridoxamine 5'-phosphate oxidase family protein [Victivallaceae bacterium]
MSRKLCLFFALFFASVAFCGEQADPMVAIGKVSDFMKSAGYYFIATVDGDQARVRPFGTVNVFDGRLYIQTGRKKNVARQISVNPNVEICAFKDGVWLRLSGQLVEDTRREARKSMLDAYPSLRSMYSEDDGNTMVLYFKNAVATFYSFKGEPVEYRF